MNSYVLKKVISYAAPVLSGMKTHALLKPYYAGLGHILMFHRVIPWEERARIHNHQSLEISPEQFEQVLRFFLDRGYACYSLDELHERMLAQEFDRPFFVITFDDGYRDNYEHAFPILQKYQLDFTIYLITDFINRKAILWWYLLEELVLKEEEVKISMGGNEYSFNCRNRKEKEHAFSEIRRLINANYQFKGFTEQLEGLFAPYGIDIYAYTDRMAMNWKEVVQLSQEEICTLGAHTVSHPPLIQVTADQLEEEIDLSRRIIESRIEKPVMHFAYPYGKRTEASLREFDFVRTHGFKTGTTTRMGNIFPEHKDHLECLPRLSVNRVTNEHVLNLQTSGMLPFIVHKGKKIITN